MEQFIANMITQIGVFGMVAVPVGYLAMIFARSGYYKQDDKMTRSLIILLFASFYSGLYKAIMQMAWFQNHETFTSFLSGMLMIIGAILWRNWLMEKAVRFMNKLSITNENGKGTTLNALINDTSIHINAITVFTKTERKYHGDLEYVSNKNFNKVISSPLITMDETGFLFPVTSFSFDDGEYQDTVIENERGIVHTYIPFSEIRSVDFTITKK